MIRGPVLPLLRDGLWRLLKQRTALFERGLRLVAEQVELGTGELAPVDGLMRDAGGAPVLVFTTDDREPTLPARVLAAYAFWVRNADGMARALPEADLREAARCRVLIIGSRLREETVQALVQLQLGALEIVEVDTFRLGAHERSGGQERVVVHAVHGRSAGGSAIDGGVSAAAREHLTAFQQMVGRLDAKILVEGDRFSRRASFEGHMLGECWFSDDAVQALVAGGTTQRVDKPADVRAVVDQLARRYLDLQGVRADEGKSNGASVADTEDEPQQASDGLEAVRASLRAARLTREEREALHEVTLDREEEERAGDS